MSEYGQEILSIDSFGTDCQISFESIGEESEDELQFQDPLEFNQAVVWGTDWTTETIASQLEKGNIDLNPKFQRRDAWTDAEKSKFIESLILGIPVPPIVLAENKGRKNSFIVIDGKQRLLSIRRFFSEISEQDVREKHLDEEEVFVQLKLRQLAVLKNLNGYSKSDIEENTDLFTSLENSTIRTVVIKNWPTEEFLYTVFLRLNTGSKKLSPQELRQALHPGAFLDFLDLVTSKSNVIKKCLITLNLIRA